MKMGTFKSGAMALFRSIVTSLYMYNDVYNIHVRVCRSFACTCTFVHQGNILSLQYSICTCTHTHTLQEWALGLMHTKCMCGAIWLTNIGFKQTLDQVYQAGVRNLNLTFVVKEVAWPVILGLSLSIALPYILFMGVFHDFGT